MTNYTTCPHCLKQTTARKAPEGSARRIWAAAQLAQLRGGEREGAKRTKGTKGAGGGR